MIFPGEGPSRLGEERNKMADPNEEEPDCAASLSQSLPSPAVIT
jgi:hypothetical protein